MISYVKCFDSNKTMCFKVIDNKLLKNYRKVWEKICSLMKTKFDSEPVYGDNDKYIKTKKSHMEIPKVFKSKKCQKKMHHINAYY